MGQLARPVNPLNSEEFERFSDTFMQGAARFSSDQLLELADRLHDLIRCRDALREVQQRRAQRPEPDCSKYDALFNL